jgi:hypothetical protein
MIASVLEIIGFYITPLDLPIVLALLMSDF